MICPSRYLIFSIVLCTVQMAAQNCSLKLVGKVIDHHDEKPLDFTLLYLVETNQIQQTDSSGQFLFDKLCPGEYHLIAQHFGCEKKNFFFKIWKDTFLLIEMEHHPHHLQSVTVRETKLPSAAANYQHIHAKDIIHQIDKPLSNLLEQLEGVYSIKNGSGIAKPVIQGLSGNRIAILNNGILQAGQQWGVDHAPEIDPFAASQITVIKGVEALAYGGNGLGNLILLEPGPVQKDPHLHGSAQMIYQDNGRQLHNSFKLEKSSDLFDWRFAVSGKISGDHQSPDYFLSNTGSRNISMSYNGVLHPATRANHKFYYSFYFINTGVLRGSHIGNLTDLENALERDTPFFTKNNFSYSIEAPRQSVAHHLLKYSYQWDKSNVFRQFDFAGQLNTRKEFDVRRAGRSETPALSLVLQSYNANFKETRTVGSLQLQNGIQFRFLYNINQSGTGILPLIPDYWLYNPGAYFKWSGNTIGINWETGGRIDFNAFTVHKISNSLPRSLETFKHHFFNPSVAIGLSKTVTSHWTMKFNAGWTVRSPEPNELYSNGLHQAVAGIEEGEPGLEKEESYKINVGMQFSPVEWISLELNAYYQDIQNYIYLQALPEPRLTIRGAFPVFQYRQNNAVFKGIDAHLNLEPIHGLQLKLVSSYLRARQRNGNELVYIPPYRFNGSLNYELLPFDKFSKTIIGLEIQYTGRQKHYNPENEFLVPPNAYILLAGSVSTNFIAFKQQWSAFFRIENILNKSYRDYLNRLRYYADEEGRALRIGLRIDF